MPESKEKLVWTIGHSTHTLETFVSMLQSFNIQLVADIRSYPGSRRYPHFNKESLEISLLQYNIGYLHLKELGGRRAPVEGSVNTGWRHSAFRGYADYMQTAPFKEGMRLLEKMATEYRTAFMCSEAVWWSCHRSLVSDLLKFNGWKVMHISGVAKEKEHPYTSPARIVNGVLSYAANELF